jgi:hypothetical protein
MHTPETTFLFEPGVKITVPTDFTPRQLAVYHTTCDFIDRGDYPGAQKVLYAATQYKSVSDEDIKARNLAYEVRGWTKNQHRQRWEPSA